MAPNASPRPRVLLVDDDARLVHVVSLYLHVQQIDVSSTGSAEAAIRLLSQALPDLLILDVMLPGVDGITLCRQVRSLAGAASLPILVFTALSDRRDIEAARAAGADRVITKPFSLAGLGAAVEALVPRGAAAGHPA